MKHFLRDGAVWLNNPAHLLLALLSLLPIFLVLVYVESYRLETPFRDEWNLNGRVAVAAADGTLTLDTIAYVAGGHRTLFTNLLTAASTVWQQWDLRVLGLLTPVLAVILLALMILLFRRSVPDMTAVVLIPFALLIFAVYRSYNWWSVRQSHWTLVNVFFVATLLILARERLSRGALVLAVVLAVCTTFSSAAGMLVWPIMVVVLWCFGQRSPRIYAAWILPGLVSVVVYLINSGMLPGLSTRDINPNDKVVTVVLPRLGDFLGFMLNFVGNGLLADKPLARYATWVGIVGVIAFVVQLAALWRGGSALKRLAPWLALAAFGIGSGLLIALARVHENTTDRALTVQYIAPVSLFWLALVALMVLVARRYDRPGVGRLLVVADVVIAFAMTCVYGFSTLNALQSEAFYWNRGLTLVAQDRPMPEEQCVEDYLFSRDAACLDRISNSRNEDARWLDQLAARRLAIFATLPRGSVLPGDYQPGSPIVLATSDGWLNVHTRDLLLDGVDESALFHVVIGGGDLSSVVATIPRPLVRVDVDGSPPPDFAVTLAGAHQLWLLQTPGTEDWTDAYVRAAEQLGYVTVYESDVGRANVPIQFSLTGLARLDDAPRLLFRLGDHVSLQEWLLEGSVDVPQCGSVALQSLWSTDAALPLNYAVTAVLAGDDGIGVARADAPTSLLSSHWQPGGFYLDRRTVSIPCDLQAGDYSLLLGMYDPATLKSLPVTTSDGGPVGGLIYLTTLHVG